MAVSSRSLMVMSSLDNAIQIIIFIISLSLFLKRPVPRYLRFFPLYFFLLGIEGYILFYTSSHGIHNNILSNNWGIAEFCFYFFVVREIVSNTLIKKVILYSTLIYAFFSLINIFFIQHYDVFNSVNFTIGSILTVVFCIYYFVELFQKTEVQSLTRSPSFWIVSGLLFGTVLTFPMFALISFMDLVTKSSSNASRLIFTNLDAIFDIIIVLTYILYSIGFLCRIRINRSIS
jgi:hypothetical protein